MGLQEKLNLIYNNTQKVYDAGFDNGSLVGGGGGVIIPQSKIIKKTYVDTHQIYLDDVSEVPHDIKVKLTNKNTNSVVPNQTIISSNQNIIQFDNNDNNIKLKTSISGAVGGKPALVTNLVCITLTDVKVMPLTTYTVTLDNSVYWFNRMCEIDKDGNMTVNHSMYTNENNDYKSYRFTSHPDTRSVMMVFKNKVNDDISLESLQLSNLQLEYGSSGSNYTLRKYTEYTTDTNGEVTINSRSPYLLLDANSDDINIEVTYNKSWGINHYQRSVWDALQQKGERTSYSGMFQSWYDDKAFKPIYDLKCVGSASSMFWGAKLGNVKQVLERQGVQLDTSEATTFAYFLRDMGASHLPAIDLTQATNVNYFGYSSQVYCIEKLIVSESTPFVNTSFQHWYYLYDVRIEGSIGSTINLQWSTMLSRASIESFVEHLSDNTSGLSATFSKTAVVKAFGSEDNWNTYINGKKSNWTINIV